MVSKTKKNRFGGLVIFFLATSVNISKWHGEMLACCELVLGGVGYGKGRTLVQVSL